MRLDQSDLIKVPSREFGLIPAALTPLDSHYKVDYDQFEGYIRWLLSFDVGGLAINVDTGEGPHLYQEERTKILRAASEIVKGKVPIVAGLQAINTEEAVELAKGMKRAGANAVMVFPHPAFKGESPDDIICDYHRQISEGGDIPIVLFDLQPVLGGVEYNPETLLRLIEIRNVIAIKEASFNAKKFADVVRTLKKASRKITLLTGNDDFIYESLILGAEGGLLGFGTVAVKEQVEMFDLVGKQRYGEAREIWERKLLPLEEVLFAPPVRNYRVRLKEALVQLGVLKTSFVRPPLQQISPGERDKIRDILNGLEMVS